MMSGCPRRPGSIGLHLLWMALVLLGSACRGEQTVPATATGNPLDPAIAAFAD